MRCPKCYGVGQVDNPRYYNAVGGRAYELGISSRKKCPGCKGEGYTGVDLNRIKNTLEVCYNHLSDADLKKSVKYALEQFK